MKRLVQGVIGVLVVSVMLAGPSAPQVGVGSTPVAVAQATTSGQSIQELIAASGQAAIKAAIAQVAPGVVKVEVVKRVLSLWDQFFQDPFFRRFFDIPLGDRTVTSIGSGFVVEHAGKRYVLTNAHVVEGATSIRVTSKRGKELPAKLVGTDGFLDLAVLAVEEALDVPPVPLGNSAALEIGDWVIAIGNPLGLSHTVTLGIVSALGRDVPKPDGSGYYRRMIQTDAAINPGNSGGPLVNAFGQVVGMNTIIARSTESGVAVEGINFAVPINEIIQALSQIATGGKVRRAWLGVYIQDVLPGMEKRFGVTAGQGVVVTEVVPGGPAEKAGVKSGDVIVAVGTKSITNTDDLQLEIMYRSIGEKVELGIIRGGTRLTLLVILGERPAEELPIPPSPAKGEPAAQKFGLTVQEISPELAQRYGLRQTVGVVVVEVAPGSKAYWAGVTEGDVIVAVNQTPVQTAADWNRIVSGIREGDEMLLTVIRGGRTRFLLLR